MIVYIYTHQSKEEAQGALNQPPANTNPRGGCAVPSSLLAELAHAPTAKESLVDKTTAPEPPGPHNWLLSQLFSSSFFLRACLQQLTD
jgi:hypothetical protein